MKKGQHADRIGFLVEPEQVRGAADASIERWVPRCSPSQEWR
jgi:hypothetical protein